MSKVYALQVPKRKDPSTGAFSPVFNISPAMEYGDITVVLPADSSFYITDDMMSQLNNALKSFDPESDYILAIGDPAIIAGAGAIIGSRHDYFKLLRWDRMIKRYIPLEIKL